MVAAEMNETATYLLDWAQTLSITIFGVMGVTWPLHLYFINRTDKEALIQQDRSDKEHALKLLEYDRSLKRDKEVIAQVVNEVFQKNLKELKENYFEVQRLIRDGQLK